VVNSWEDGPRRPPSEYLSRRKLNIPPEDQIPMHPGHKARKDLSDNADLDFQAVGPALCIMQLNIEGLSANAYNKKKNRG